MNGRLLGPAAERLTPVVVAAKAAGAVPNGMVAIEMAADEHAQARTASAPPLLGELQGELLGRDDIVAADHALMFDAEDLLEIHAAQRSHDVSRDGYDTLAKEGRGGHAGLEKPLIVLCAAPREGDVLELRPCD